MAFEFKELRNKNEWNDFLINFQKKDDGRENFSFIQSYQWLELQELYGRKVYPLGIYQDDKLIGVSAGIGIRARRGSYLYVRNGPVIDWNNSQLVEALISHYKYYAKKNGLWFIRISPLISKQDYSNTTLSKYSFSDCSYE
ncbi:MAG: peptidoglycan bridge formation glycyltransferase FemA/FemB family protein [Candidatus Dojkabacteria bacterium]|nr:peptidoglycan bridge formation glycyltransferase FemA/FemB family protein [Candidatus Dojkabacteria bacterium]